jgi:hypothetical protein
MGGGRARPEVTFSQARRQIAWSDRVVRGGVEPPTFRLQAGWLPSRGLAIRRLLSRAASVDGRATDEA